MSKFDKSATATARGPQGPVRTTDQPTPTAEGGAGWSRDVKSELFLLSVTNMVGERTFYETGKERDSRFATLVRQATAEDPDWTARLIRWLRAEANMRSASVVAAGEYVKAGGPHGRAVVASALQRADEPAEMLAYWTATYGRAVPKPVKRGVADAAVRLYNENAALKYDGLSRGFRMGDVIDLTHPSPSAPWQADLFRWLLDCRHNRPDPRLGESLQKIRAHMRLEGLTAGDRRTFILTGEFPEYGHVSVADTLAEAGMTWESLSGWLQGPMDAAAWTAVIPSMGYMALLRNLRNFDQAGVSDSVAQTVAARLADPEQVAKSRQFPLRFLSAFKAAPSLRWAWALEQAMQHSLVNVPSLPGRTLVLVDLSGSMWSSLSDRSELQRWEAAALFGFALGLRAQAADVYVYGTGRRRVDLPKAASLLPTIKGLPNMGGTDTFGTLAASYTGHDRTVILTDEQADTPGFSTAYGYGYANTADPETVLRGVRGPIYTFNLAGYKAAHLASGTDRITVGGLTDAGFRLIDLLERQRGTADWPF